MRSTLYSISLILYFYTILFIVDSENIKIGVMIIDDYGGPYDWKKSGAAIRLALEKVNNDILKGTPYQITAIEKQYGPGCDQKETPGNNYFLYYDFHEKIL